MKKGEIKRRKRVMPAMIDQSPAQGTGFESSVSPDPAVSAFAEPSIMSSEEPQKATQTALPHHDRHGTAHVLEPQYRSVGPPPVDFTSYANASREPSLLVGTTAGRKRSRGEAEGASPIGHHLHTALSTATTTDQRRLSLSAAPDGRDNVAIDPSLAAFASAAVSAATAVGGGESKEQARARLLMERERMRQSLAEVDDELAKMEEPRDR